MADGNNILRLAALNDATPDWLGECLKTSAGRPLSVLHNAMLALRSDQAVSACFARDEMFCGPLLLREIPGSDLAERLPRLNHFLPPVARPVPLGCARHKAFKQRRLRLA